jgi:hypothetical protein
MRVIGTIRHLAQTSGGEMPSPSALKRISRRPPGEKAGLVSSISIASAPIAGSADTSFS